MTQARWTPAWPEAEQEGPDAPRPAEPPRRRARDRFIQTQPPPPHPTPGRPDRDDDEPTTGLPAARATEEDRLLAEIDELVAACECP
ncbi:hypothetical protein [Actinoplanes subtropicus]|uniref:hypothetical protein n=1 Tax=Actinoplanes subtropicus TaxID=543632 RepID=UPI0004C474A8|nr:hypothetical protein [Actinoplanes subtropicus]